MKDWNRQRVAQLIEQEGRTKKWLAGYCGINIDSLNHYLAGRRYPPRPVIKLIAQALNTHEEELMGDYCSLGLALEEVKLNQT